MIISCANAIDQLLTLQTSIIDAILFLFLLLQHYVPVVEEMVTRVHWTNRILATVVVTETRKKY